MSISRTFHESIHNSNSSELYLWFKKKVLFLICSEFIKKRSDFKKSIKKNVMLSMEKFLLRDFGKIRQDF